MAVVPSLRGVDTFPTTRLVVFVPVAPNLIEIATLDTPICRSFFFVLRTNIFIDEINDRSTGVKSYDIVFLM